MANYIFNEKLYIENFLKGEKIDEKIGMRYIIGLLFRYYSIYDEEKVRRGLAKKQILQDLKRNGSFDKKEGQKKLEDYEIEKTIQSVINKQKKYYKENGCYKPLKQLDYVPLYSSEMEYIKNMETDQRKKFMFTCYILARFYNTTWVNSSATEIFKLANITKSSKDKDLFISKLLREDKISMSDYITSLAIKLKDLKQEDDEVVLKVYEMKDLGNLILATIKPNYKQCKECGKLIKIKSKNDHRRLYCDKCKIKKQAEWDKNKYEKSKIL